MHLIRQTFDDFFKISKFVLRDRNKLIPYFLLLCGYVAAKQVFPLFLREIVDVYIPSKNLDMFSLFLYTLFIIKAFEFLSMIGSALLGYLASSKFILYLKINFLRLFFRLKASYVDNQTTGAIMQRLNGDINNIQVVIYEKFFGLMSDLLQIIWLIPLVFWLNHYLAILIFIIMPLNVALSLFFGKKNRCFAKAIAQTNDVMSSFLYERVKNYRMVKYFASEKMEIKAFIKHFRAYSHSFYRKVLYSQLSGVFYQLSVELTPIIILFVGGHLIFSGHTTLGTVLALINYSSRIFYPLRNLLSATEDFNQLSLSLARYNEYFADENFERHDGAKVRFAGNITFDKVSFGYEGREPILQDLNFSIMAGSKIAFTGQSGVGKTSILNMLLSIYPHKSGKILIENQEIGSINLKHLRKQIGVVAQDTLILNGSLYDNIVYGQKVVDKNEISRVCHIAGLDEMIRKLPDGYDSVVGEGGIKLSGGEKQRLAIARSLLKKRDVYFFDEATSQIDVVLEKQIWQRLFEYLEGKTMLIIAHRLSTIICADQIFVIADKTIVESGSHQRLLEQQGVYAGMWRSMRLNASD